MDEIVRTVTAEQKEYPSDIHSGNHTCLTATRGYATTFYDVQVSEHGNLLKRIIQAHCELAFVYDRASLFCEHTYGFLLID